MSLFKQCMNIKSRKVPNERCILKATHNEFCSKHYKKPILFIFPDSMIQSAIKIQKVWRNYYSNQFFSRQGPARNDVSLTNNSSDIYTLDTLNTIPKIYFFSFYDSKKHIWGFDIRTLSYLLSKSKITKNPYTQEILSQEILNKINSRLHWLKKHKYSILYEDSELTTSQMWNQRVLDVFNKMDELGYLVNSEWFHEMDKEDHIEFYKKLYDIWNYRINMPISEKNLIVPGFNRKNKLFKFSFDELNLKEEKFISKNNLQIIDRIISSSDDKNYKVLGIMYVLMGLSYVSNEVSNSYSWISATLN